MNGLRTARKAAGLTLKQLSRKSGVPLSTISAYETGRINVGDSVIKKLAEALDVKPDGVKSGDLEQTVLAVLNAGPSGAAKKMSEKELVARITTHARKLKTDANYMRGAHAEIISALALELYGRSASKKWQDESK